MTKKLKIKTQTSRQTKKVNLTFALSPEQKAYFEILHLWGEYSGRSSIVLGGPTPPEMQAKEKLLWAEFDQKKAAIFKKHGVAQTY